jgi:hypothetical protein
MRCRRSFKSTRVFGEMTRPSSRPHAQPLFFFVSFRRRRPHAICENGREKLAEVPSRSSRRSSRRSRAGRSAHRKGMHVTPRTLPNVHVRRRRQVHSVRDRFAGSVTDRAASAHAYIAIAPRGGPHPRRRARFPRLASRFPRLPSFRVVLGRARGLDDLGCSMTKSQGGTSSRAACAFLSQVEVWRPEQGERRDLNFRMRRGKIWGIPGLSGNAPYFRSEDQALQAPHSGSLR